MTYWWVNQGQTWRHEVSDGYLWAPKLDKAGRRNRFYDNMVRVLPGDVVFSYFNSAVRFAAIAAQPAVSEPRPDFGFANSFWGEDGWMVVCTYVELPIPVPLADIVVPYKQFAPTVGGPLDQNGSVMTRYLCDLTDDLGDLLLQSGALTLEELRTQASLVEETDSAVLSDAPPSRLLTETQRLTLAHARRGQGYFKEEVQRFEPSCRITGLALPRHLIASHMKPWAASSNVERLDGANGLLLSPHIDHLFDRGLITFRKDGKVLASPRLSPEVHRHWKLDFGVATRPFRSRQLPYLEYHQESVFQRAALR